MHNHGMKTRNELALAANRSFVGSFRTLVAHTPGAAARQWGGVFAFATGLPMSLFNGCAVVAQMTAADLEAALQWVGARRVPYQVWIDETAAPGLDPVAAARGLQRDPLPYPGMVLHPIPEPPAAATGVTVTPVTTEAELRDYHDLCVQEGLPPALALRLYSSSLVADPDVQLFMARLDGRPAGHAVAIRTGDVSGVYAVGTLASVRRRGVATAATWGAVAAGRAWGTDTIALQASEMGFSLYAAMGFRTVVPYASFKRATA